MSSSTVIPAQAGIQGGLQKKHPCVYILASQRNGTLYTGVTANLCRRMWEHKNDVIKGFTRKYKVHMLVWYETHLEMTEAIRREKQLKKWERKWKLRIIEEMNPQWKDLYESLLR